MLWPGVRRTCSCSHFSRFYHTISTDSHVTSRLYHRKGLHRPSTVSLRRCTTIMPKAGYYAVKIGKRPGIYTSWLLFFSHPQSLLTLVIREDCREQVDGYPCARYKKLRTLEEAEAWMQPAVPYPIKQNIKRANHSLGKSRTSIGSQRNGRVPASSSSSTVELAAPGQSRSQSTATDPSSSRSHATAGPSRMSAIAEDVVYTDGACSGNGQLGSVAGTGVWWGLDDPRYVPFHK